MSIVRVEHLGGDRFAVAVRTHTILVDQPEDAGGQDTAPTPTELFIASLASCVAFYARRYLSRHQLPADGFAVTAEYTMEPRPSRVGSIRLDVRLPTGFPAERRDALLAVAAHCTVHNTLEAAPEVTIALDDTSDSSAGPRTDISIP